MGATENFYLRWNDFEANISSSIRDLQRCNEFFDVTLCCDNGNDLVHAHRVVLAAGSPLFRKILSKNPSPNPFLYLKGVKQKELEAVLNFMYHGEVKVAQDSLNNFLTVAEELAVNGLSAHHAHPDSRKRLGSTYAEVHLPHSEDGAAEEQLDLHSAPDCKDTPKIKAARSKRLRPVMSKGSTSGPSAADESDDATKRVKLGSEAMHSLMDANDPEAEQEDNDDGDNRDPDPEHGAFFDDDYDRLSGLDEDKGEYDQSGAGTSSVGEASDSHEGFVEEAKFSRTQQGNALLVDTDGFCYVMNRKRERRIYWKCHQQRKQKCRGCAITEGFFIVRRANLSQHTHSPLPLPTNKYNKEL